VDKRIVFISLLILGFALRNFGQTVYAPFMYCAQDAGTNGNINLTWGDPTNNTCGAFVQYNIFASSNGPTGPYTQVATITTQATTTYTLNGLVTNTHLYWYFYMTCTYNCPGGTVLSSDTINNISPTTPQIISVTVTPNNQSIITFQSSPSEQTTSYILYYFLPNGSALPWDTIYGRNNTVVTDTSTLSNRNPSNFSQVFTVAAVDSCGDISSYSTSPQNTILATAANTECQRQVNITWNKYKNWPQGVEQYEVWVSRNGGPFVEDGSTDSSILNYAYTNFNTGDTLQIYILALSAADTNIVSSSNLIHLKAIIVQPPGLTNVTVNAANQIYMTWTVDTIAQLIYYEILQSVTDSINYLPAEQLNVPSPLQHFEIYGDSLGVYPQNNPYYYEIDAYDSCQNQYISGFAETICLKGDLYDYYVAQLTWNNFELANATVAYYNLYRDFGNGFQLLRTFQPGINQYFDSLQAFLNDKGTFCYYTEAVYYINLPSPSGYHDTLTSTSNQVCIVHRPVIYVPNAFAPGGGVPENTTFKPTIIYGSPSGYSLIIFNRWGAKIFESNNPQIGWDGTTNGKEVEMGGYAYLIDFTADDGTAIERKGMVILVR
jgi:gliding motility-associated-like protein